MDKQPLVTVILTAWNRLGRLEEIVDRWLDTEGVGEVILWDNSQRLPAMKTHIETSVDRLYERARQMSRKIGGHDKDKAPKLIVVRSSHNFGASARYGLADLTSNDWLLYADDDYMPNPGIVGDLMDHARSAFDVVGIKGRLFNGSYLDNDEIRTEHLAADAPPIQVDMLIGHIMLVHRSLMLPFQYRDAAWFCCELEWEARVRELFPNVHLWVVPSVGVQELSEASDGHSLYRDPLANAEKQRVWDRYYKDHCIRDKK